MCWSRTSRAGILEKLGLGPEARPRPDPSLIAISMPAFGNDGPCSGIRAYGSTVEQASGLPYVNGRDDWPPCLQHVAFGDPLVGLYARRRALRGAPRARTAWAAVRSTWPGRLPASVTPPTP
jgi:crotonobetainyl-CoA:carnitine CoA-transferase CaiB-like acyl-CoA transferase